MQDKNHKNILAIRKWLDDNGVDPTMDPDILFQIYKDINYYGQVTTELSYSTRVRICKKQIDFIQKSMMFLMHQHNDSSAKGLRPGYVYALANKAWPDYVKIGCAVDVYDRLNSYQTSSPFRDYELLGYIITDDRLLLEKQILNSFDRVGEWVVADRTTMKKFISTYTKYPDESIRSFCVSELLTNAGHSQEVLQERRFIQKCKEVMRQTLNVLHDSGIIQDSKHEMSNHLVKQNNLIINQDVAYCEKYDITFFRDDQVVYTSVNY